MIEEIRIRSLGVIEESVLELGPGFTAVTGETGAGKTMVVTALGLLLGGRADPSAVRTGESSARVEGWLRLPAGAPWAASLREEVDALGGETDVDSLVVARQISAEGRSRAFAGGTSCPVGALGRVVEPLVAVHGQSDQHRLLAPGAQREALDRFAGAVVLALRAEVEQRHDALRVTRASLAEVRATVRERAREADLLRLGLAEIEQVAPVEGEEETLAADEARLGFADTLRAAAEQAREALSSDESATGGPGDALGAVGLARRELDAVREHDPEVAALADRLAEVSYLLADVAADTASYASSVETDPARLAAVSERRASLTALTRKYGDDAAAVLRWARAAAERLVDLEGTEDQITALEEAVVAQRRELGGLAASLSEAREDAAARLARVVTEELHALAMPHARLEVTVRRQATEESDDRAVPAADGWWVLARSGADEVELQLAANRGTGLRPLARGASGGELSRVMLALEVALAASQPVPTLVFDEVDAGVGGKAAVEVGRRLAALSRHAQVVVVTHLPQVAAFADRHVVVEKSSDGAVTTSGLTGLDDVGRVRELSRMLAGLEDSATARAHAEELLGAAQEARAAR